MQITLCRQQFVMTFNPFVGHYLGDITLLNNRWVIVFNFLQGQSSAHASLYLNYYVVVSDLWITCGKRSSLVLAITIRMTVTGFCWMLSSSWYVAEASTDKCDLESFDQLSGSRCHGGDDGLFNWLCSWWTKVRFSLRFGDKMMATPSTSTHDARTRLIITKHVHKMDPSLLN